MAGNTFALALGDADGDGDIDALVGSFAQPNRLLLNNGSGVFGVASGQLPGFSDGTGAVALQDVDGDGDLDAWIGNGGSFVAILDRLYLNDGAGTFTYTVPLPPILDTTLAIALGDVDADGDLDALMGNNGQSRLTLNDGSGAFTDGTSQLPAITAQALAAALGDVDGDGDLDALIGTTGSPLPQDLLFLNDGSGVFADSSGQLPPVSDNTSAVTLGDVDGDGDLDALMGNVGLPDRLYLNDGAGLFLDATGQVPASFEYTGAIALGDVDGDGDLDAWFGNGGQDRLALNDGSGVFGDATALVPAFLDPTNAVAFGDVDEDGDLDVLVGNGGFPFDPAQNRLHLNDGSGVFSDATAQLPAVLAHTRALGLGDLDGDGDLDALIGNAGPVGQDRLYVNDGSGLFSDATPQLAAVPDNTFALALGDLDGDGDLDALLGNPDQEDRLLVNVGRQLAWRGVPRIGKPLTLDLFGPSLGAWFLGVSFGTANLPIPPLGTLRLAPASLAFVFGGLLDGGGRAAYMLPVPANPSLLGVPVYWQAVVAGPARFTNLEITAATNL